MAASIHKYKNFKRALAGIAFFVFLFILVENFFFVEVESGLWSFLGKKNIDMLILGTSRSYASFDTNILSAMFDRNIFVRGVQGSQMTINRENLKVVLNYQAPKIIAVDIDSLYVDPQGATTSGLGFTIDNFIGVKNIFYKFQAISNLELTEYAPLMIFQILQNHKMWSRINAIWNKNKKTGRYDCMLGGGKNTYGGYLRSRIIKIDEPIDVKIQKGSPKNEEYYDENLKTFEQISDLSKQNNSELWAFQIPTLYGNGKERKPFCGRF